MQMNKDLQCGVDYSADKKHSPSIRLQPLFAFLNIQLEVLIDNLYRGVFKKILRQVFSITVKVRTQRKVFVAEEAS